MHLPLGYVETTSGRYVLCAGVLDSAAVVIDSSSSLFRTAGMSQFGGRLSSGRMSISAGNPGYSSADYWVSTGLVCPASLDLQGGAYFGHLNSTTIISGPITISSGPGRYNFPETLHVRGGIFTCDSLSAEACDLYHEAGVWVVTNTLTQTPGSCDPGYPGPPFTFSGDQLSPNSSSACGPVRTEPASPSLFFLKC